MDLSASEKATLNFYEWEYRGRGYYHFDEVVHIEPPFIPFQFKEYNDKLIDDGKVPSLFSRISKFLEKPVKEEFEEKKEALIPNPCDSTSKLKGFSLSFAKEQDIFPVVFSEFLNMLSFSEQSISFEIIGTSDSITIQIVCGLNDLERIRSHLVAYFPKVKVKNISVFDFGFDRKKDIAIADFGLKDEFMRPINTFTSFAIDPLTSIIAILDNLHDGDTVLFQLIFRGVTAPWSKSMIHSISDGTGGSFFVDAPEMILCAKEKVSTSLFSCIIRIATQGNKKKRSNYLALQLSQSISSISCSEFNKLIPLSNEGYEYDNHLFNIYYRTSNRLGMILNTKELISFFHYPNKTVISEKLHPSNIGRTKILPQKCLKQKYTLGVNKHEGIENFATINDIQRLQHCHILGVTGVGKSTLIANMILSDMESGNGCVLLDPHGDISNDVLMRIPEHRKKDVIILDPSDTDFPIGFNLLCARTDAEKIVLSSDLVSAFKHYSTSWGDNMTSVLSNAINTFLENNNGGTLIELKRFLIEERFRKTFLKNIVDSSILYYWKYEYPMVKKGIAPLLTRIDTFLRPKIIRYIFAQKDGIDFENAIENKKIIIIKLSQGLIGEENSYLLGSLFLSKINQVAYGRQNIPKEQRHPYYIYLDEFHNFITPSIASMLSGARKYGIGLTLAHQEIGQIENPKILSSIISNPHIRICFRLGDNDAKRLENGFSYFEQNDLQGLGVGEAIVRVGSNNMDFNLETPPLSPETKGKTKDYIVNNTRQRFSKKASEIKDILDNLLPRPNEKLKKKNSTITKESVTNEINKLEQAPNSQANKISEEIKQALIEQEEISISNRDHNYLQTFIKKLGQERDYISIIEKETKEGGRIDITLEKDTIKIAFEISITNTPQYEVKNIKKCLSNGYLPVVMVSKNKNHLDKIEKLAQKELSENDMQLVLFIQPDEIAKLLDELQVKKEANQEIIKGFRITTKFEQPNSLDSKSIRQHIAKLLFKKK